MVTKHREYFEEILELLEPLGDVTGKAMFGGYGYWERGDMFALLSSGGLLYFKADDATEARFRKAKSAQFAPDMPSGRDMRMPYWTVPKSVIKDDARFAEWAAEAIAVGHATSKKKPAKKAATKKAAVKKAAVTKAPVKKAPVKKAPAKKASATKAVAKRR